MTLSDAANLVTVEQGTQHILNDPTLSPRDKVTAMEALQAAAAEQPDRGLLSSGDLVRGAIGAGIGYGAAKLFGGMLTTNPSTLNMIQGLGIGLGTLINTGLLLNKMSNDMNNEQERLDAFRLGFCKAALDLGLFLRDPPSVLGAKVKTKLAGIVGTVPIVEAFKAPMDLASNVTGTAATTGGALLGHLTGDTSDDVDLTNMALQQRELEGRADALQQGRHAALLKKVLDRRRMGR